MDAISFDKKKLFYFIASIIAVIIGYLLPAPAGLSEAGKMTLVILVFLFIMWIGNVLPKSIASFAALLMMPLFGVIESLSAVYTTFVNSIFFFLIGVFGIAAVVNRSDIPARLMVFFVHLFGNNSAKLIFAFATTTWVVSALMSDLAAAALVAGIVIGLSEELNLPKNFMRCLMIAVPIGAMTGGVLMPISSSTNVTIMQFVFDITGSNITFLQWMIVGVPVGILSFVFGVLLVILILKPEPLDDECMVEIHAHFQSLGAYSTYDKKAIALIVCMLVAWMLGSWIPLLNSTFVALVGLIVMFIPGVDLLTWDEYQKQTPFDLIFMLGAMFSLCAAMTSCGTISWFVQNVMTGATGWSPTMFFLILSTMLVVVRAFIPSGAPVVVMLCPSLLAMGEVIGIDPMVILIALATWCQVTALMPVIDSVWLMTYRYGAFSILDCVKVGIPLSIILILLLTFLLPPLASLSYAVL